MHALLFALARQFLSSTSRLNSSGASFSSSVGLEWNSLSKATQQAELCLLFGAVKAEKEKTADLIHTLNLAHLELHKPLGEFRCFSLRFRGSSLRTFLLIQPCLQGQGM